MRGDTGDETGGEVDRETQLHLGQRWQFLVKLNRPHGFANPNSYDYERWLFEQGITAKGYVRASELNIKLIDPGARSLLGRFWSRAKPALLRESLRRKLTDALTGLDNKAIVMALVLGESDAISPQLWQLFTRTGTNHLFIISGLHIGFVAGMCYLLSLRLLRFLPSLLLFFPAQKWACLGAVLAAAAYSFLAGFSLPTQRALVMVSMFMLAKILGANVRSSSSLLIALVIVLTVKPLAAASAGFWLSFVAVAVLLSSHGAIMMRHVNQSETAVLNTRDSGHKALWWARFIRPQLLIFVALLVPLSIYLQQISLLSPLLNILAIPMISIIIVPLCLLALVTMLVSTQLSIWLFSAADHCIAVLLWVLTLASDAIGQVAVLPVMPASALVYLAAALACGLLLLPSQWPYRYLALPLVLPLLLPRLMPSLGLGLVVNVLDVGQGLAVVVRTQSHVLVYDTGPRFNDDFDTGSAVLAPFLMSQGITKIDRLIISHNDNDHAGGLTGLMENITVAELMFSDHSLLDGLPTSSLTTLLTDQCRRGQRWWWDGVQFEILHPPATVPAGIGRSFSDNNNSCVLRVSLGKRSVLLPGDIENEAEQAFLRYMLSADGAQHAKLHSTVLIAPHHGSMTSSSHTFAALIRPQSVIFSSGYHNRFAHPAMAIVQRYTRLGARLYNTANTGMLSLVFEGDNSAVKIEAYRDSHHRYWF